MDAPKEVVHNDFRPSLSFREVMLSTKPLIVVLAEAPIIDRLKPIEISRPDIQPKTDTLVKTDVKQVSPEPVMVSDQVQVKVEEVEAVDELIQTPNNNSGSQKAVNEQSFFISRIQKDSKNVNSQDSPIRVLPLVHNSVVDATPAGVAEVVEEVGIDPKPMIIKQGLDDRVKPFQLEQLVVPERLNELIKIPVEVKPEPKTDPEVNRMIETSTEAVSDLKMGQEVVEQLVKAGIEIDEALETVQDSLVRKGIEVSDVATLIPDEVKVDSGAIIQRLEARMVIQEVTEDEKDVIQKLDPKAIRTTASGQDLIVDIRKHLQAQAGTNSSGSTEKKKYWFVVDERARRLRLEALREAINQAFKDQDSISGADILGFLKKDKKFNSAIKSEGPDGLWSKAQEYIIGLENINSVDQALRIIEWVLDAFPGVDTAVRPTKTVGEWEVESVLRGNREFYLSPEDERVVIVEKLPQEYLLRKVA